jgi:hypothetical protein
MGTLHVYIENYTEGNNFAGKICRGTFQKGEIVGGAIENIAPEVKEGRKENNTRKDTAYACTWKH